MSKETAKGIVDMTTGEVVTGDSGGGFIIDPACSGYGFLGWASGLFEPEKGQKVLYHNMFVFSPVSSYESDDYKAMGFKAEKKKCVSPRVWNGLNPGDKVRLLFDDKARVAAVDLNGDSAGGK